MITSPMKFSVSPGQQNRTFYGDSIVDQHFSGATHLPERRHIANVSPNKLLMQDITSGQVNIGTPLKSQNDSSASRSRMGVFNNLRCEERLMNAAKDDPRLVSPNVVALGKVFGHHHVENSVNGQSRGISPYKVGHNSLQSSSNKNEENQIQFHTPRKVSKIHHLQAFPHQKVKLDSNVPNLNWR